MNSIGEECTELKKKYDDCFNSWFSERFLKGDHDDSVCAGIFKVYQDCVKNAMKQQNIEFKEIDKDVLGTEGEYKAPPSDSS
ncbi:TP53-regulated inhibitor of apoptosis 1-like [Spodoptera litura]|uniref:TP53-regulated inhibitor of apoptosis 1-like n=1 Tax=Spodoptera litura TaxID=69820 RepID=A0A9J7DPR9_SPOLT|nr:TP53-regulated inhibitor of apoptosis 1-like [Spodoptera litura]